MQRTSLGIIAVGLLVLGAWAAIGQAGPSGSSSWAGAAIKVGLVLGALWLALPQIDRFLDRTPKWLLVAALIAVVYIALHPMAAVAAVPVLVMLWFFGPATWKKAQDLATKLGKYFPAAKGKSPKRKKTS